MTIAILGLLAALIPFLIHEWLRRETKKDDPIQQAKVRDQEVDREIAQDDERAANLSLADDLDRLHALQGDKRGPDGPPSQSGQ